jgi:membrane protein implicated in regulation of membrane protease activity
MNDLGKWMVIGGLILAGAGALLWLGAGKGWFGRLPGDLHFSRGNVQFYFPIVTCLLLSVVLSLILWLFRK